MTQAALQAPDATDPRWAVLRARDAAADGTFVYAVNTTGVFCRPSCPARPAKPENVRFFATGAEAEGAGYRPCLRCRPLAIEGRDPMTGRVEALARFIRAHADEALPLARLAATERGVCFVQFGDSAEALLAQLQAEFPSADLRPAGEDARVPLDAWVTALDDHLSRAAPRPDLPLDLRGTAFQVRVWRFLLSVKPGEVVSYSELAAGVGSPRAVRAAASACAANRLAVLIPCHRALRADGGLGGYRWGLERKRALIDAERAA
jgi:O-6-methylguanine DNA methyltransferase